MYGALTYFSVDINEFRQSSPSHKFASPSPKHPCTLTPGEHDACNSTAATSLLPSTVLEYGAASYATYIYE